MNSTLKVSGIVVCGVLISIALPHVIINSTSKTLAAKKTEVKSDVSTTTNKQMDNDTVILAAKKVTEVPVEPVKEEPKVEEVQPEVVEEPKKEEQKKEEAKKEEKVEVQEQIQEPAPEVAEVKSYGEMTVDELISAIASGTYKLEYSSNYDTRANRLTKSKGVVQYAGHKETYYSEKKLPGAALKIPGRHVADDGTVRDGDGYICVAASTSYLSKGTVVKTSLGPAKVYDTGCAYGTIDIYTNW